MATRFLVVAGVLALTYGLASKGAELIWLRPRPRWSDYGFGVFLVVVAMAILYGALHFALTNRGTDPQEQYALTDRRALISRRLRNQHSVTSIPIQPNDWITGDFGELGRIVFSRSQFYRNDEGEPEFDETTEVFKDIANAEFVFDLIRRIQTGTATTVGSIASADMDPITE